MVLIGLLTFLFLGFTLINRVLEGALVVNSDIAIVSTLYVFIPVRLFWFTISVPNISFFTEGIPHLLKMDYSFFAGTAGLFTYFFYAITAMIGFLLLVTFLGVVAQKLTGRI